MHVTPAVHQTGSEPYASTTGGNYAFIIGHYKSGSTWLANLLSVHPEVRCLGETNVFRYAATLPAETATRNLFTASYWSGGGLRRLPRHRVAETLNGVRRLLRQAPAAARPSTLLDLSLREQRALRRELLGSTSGEDYCRRFFTFLERTLRPGRYLVEKTPNHVLYTPFIRTVFPDARLIAVYRDGRDVVVSDKFFSAKRGRQWNLTDSVLYWRKLMTAQQTYARVHNVFTCSYESLLEDGRTAVRALLRFLDLAEDGHIDRMLQHSSIGFLTGRAPGQEDQRSFYRKGIRGDWRNHFTDADKQQFKQLAGDLLIELGYEKDDDW